MKNIYLIGLLLFTGAVNATLIDFDAFNGNFTGGIEDGYTMTVDNGSYLVADSLFLGTYSGLSSLHHGSPTQSGITLSNGSLFTFSSLQSGGFFGGAELLTVTGILSGEILGVDTFSPLNGSYSLFSASNLAGIAIDALKIDMGPAGPGPTHIDDIVLKSIAVPEPSSLILMSLALLGIGLSRKRKTA